MRCSQYLVEVNVPMGESLKFEGTEASVSAQLQQAVLESKLSGSLQALQTTVSGEGAREEKRAAVRDLPGLRALYRPILHRMYGGMQKGFVIAALWEALYQSWALLERYQTIAVVIVFWVPVLALLGFVLFEEQIAKIITWLIPAFIAGALMGHSPMQAISLDSIVQPLTPTIGALLVSVAFATVLGLSGGAGIAGVWALLHRRNLPVAPDGPSESVASRSVQITLLLMMFVASSFCYVSTARYWPLQVEASLRFEQRS
jgi:hypothetical protein